MYSFREILIDHLLYVRIALGVWEYFGEQNGQINFSHENELLAGRIGNKY